MRCRSVNYFLHAVRPTSSLYGSGRRLMYANSTLQNERQLETFFRGSKVLTAASPHESGMFSTPADGACVIKADGDDCTHGSQSSSVKILDSSGAAAKMAFEVFQEFLELTAEKQKRFYFGTTNTGDDTGISGEKLDLRHVDGKTAIRSISGSFFEMINNRYEGRMLQEQQIEVEGYVAKRRVHYDQRLKEETEEFRRSRREKYDDKQRFEAHSYMSELMNDIQEFTSNRQRECETRLRDDVVKYTTALKQNTSVFASQNPNGNVVKGNGLIEDIDATSSLTVTNDMDDNLSADMRAFAKELQVSESDDGDLLHTLNERRSMSSEDVRNYISRRYQFYEQTMQEDLSTYIYRRKAFYEELLQERAKRLANKVRDETEKFHSLRTRFYEDKLGQDALWLEKQFQQHYDRCFLQCYAQQAWLSYRQTLDKQVSKTADTVAEMPNDELIAPNPHGYTILELEDKVPLRDVLERYAKESIEEVSRDVFLKAATRVAEEGSVDYGVAEDEEMEIADDEETSEVLESDDL